MKRLTLVPMLLILLPLLLTGHISTTHATTASDSPETAALTKRIETYWNAKLKGDHAASYAFLTPIMQRMQTKDQYVDAMKKKEAVRYLSYKILDIDTQGEVGWAHISTEVKVLNLPKYPSHQVESWTTWKKIDGAWYPLQEPENSLYPVLPPKYRLADEEAALAKRVDACWTAIEQQDWEALYSFLTPAFTEKVTLDEFLLKDNANVYLSHRIDWVQVAKPDVGQVRVVFSIRPNDPSLKKIAPQEKDIVENWEKHNGVWYRSVAAME